jgi:hypothetical protein
MQMIGEIAMPTPNEYRLRAHECLELTSEADQWYVKTALLKLAAEFQKRAERLERSNEGQWAGEATPGISPRPTR